jgi:hypothetical protein
VALAAGRCPAPLCCWPPSSSLPPTHMEIKATMPSGAK